MLEEGGKALPRDGKVWHIVLGDCQTTLQDGTLGCDALIAF